MSMSSVVIGTLTTFAVGTALLIGTTTMTAEHAAHAEELAQTVSTECQTPLLDEALSLTAGTGSGSAFDEANASCTALGVQLAPALAQLTADFDAAVSAEVTPEVQAQVDAVSVHLTPEVQEHLATLSVEDQVRYLFELVGE